MSDLRVKVQRALQEGLPIVAEPFATLAEQFGVSEEQVIASIIELQQLGLIKRFGIILRHRQLGYKANAMVVWDIPDTQVDDIGAVLGGEPCITLSYRRPRRPPRWNYNLFCMIHGKSRDTVIEQLREIVERRNLRTYPHQVLFSSHCHAQRGAVYV